MKTAIADGSPRPPRPFWTNFPENFPYLGRLVQRIRLWRGKTTLPCERDDPEADTALRWAYLLYLWLPALACACFLSLLLGALWSRLASELDLGQMPTMLGGLFLISSVILAISVALYRSRGPFQ
jgi:hypothetical protein